MIKKELKGGVKNEKYDHEAYLNSEFVRKYWDARVFGNTFLESGNAKEFIKTGVVQFGLGLSLSPVSILRMSHTSKAGVEADKNQGMAPMAYRVVEHGVYCMPFFVNPNFAHYTGCTAADIDLLKFLIPQAYDQTRSAMRTDVRIRHAWYIEHKNLLGSCPDYLLMEALTPERIGNREEPSKSWADYQDKIALPDALKDKVASCVDLVEQ